MKLFLLIATIALAQAGKLDRVYLPPNAQASSGNENFLQSPYQRTPNSGFETRPERAQAALERSAAILRQDSSNDGETYAYAFETGNGIYAEESGVATNGVQAQGGYTYTGDDGKVYSVKYTADENGFVPQGDHLPTSPPIPEEILKALEQNARDEAAGIYDDGSYSEVKYSAASNSQQQSYNTNAQPIDFNKNAAGRNGNTVEKSYLPPFAQKNNQRSSFNARDGYKY